jgi:hypothetical protein
VIETGKVGNRVRQEGDPLVLSAELQSLKRIHGPIFWISSSDLEQRHGRFEVVQLIAVAAVSRQGRAHMGSMVTRLATSVPVDSAAVAIVEVAMVVLEV